MKKRMITYTWIHSLTWIIKHWIKLKALCVEEAVDMELHKVPFVRAKLQTVRGNKVLFKIKSNSWYVCWYMMQFNDSKIKTIKK